MKINGNFRKKNLEKKEKNENFSKKFSLSVLKKKKKKIDGTLVKPIRLPTLGHKKTVKNFQPKFGGPPHRFWGLSRYRNDMKFRVLLKIINALVKCKKTIIWAFQLTTHMVSESANTNPCTKLLDSEEIFKEPLNEISFSVIKY